MNEANTPAPVEEIEEDVAAIWAEADRLDGVPADEEPPSEEEGRPSDEPDAPSQDAVAEEGTEPATASQPPERSNEPEAQPAAGDIWAKAPPEAKTVYDLAQRRVAVLEQELRSDRGRLSALTKKLEKLEKSLPDKGEEKPRDEVLRQVREEYPEVAGPLLEEMEALKESIGHLTARERAEQERQIEQETIELRKVHPDYDTLLSQHGAAFRAWVEDKRQPVWVIETVQRNAEKIVNAREVIPIIDAFKRQLGMVQRPGTEPPPAQQQAAPSPSLADKRKRQLEASVTPSPRAQPIATSEIPEEGDPQAIWDAIDREEQRKQRR